MAAPAPTLNPDEQSVAQCTAQPSAKRRVKPEPIDSAAAAAPARAQQRKRRARAGIQAAREIRHLQATTHTLGTRAQFERLVRTLADKYHSELRFSADAISILQEYSESLITQLFQEANEITVRSKRNTLLIKDLQLAMRVHGVSSERRASPLPFATATNSVAESSSLILESRSEGASEGASERGSGSD